MSRIKKIKNCRDEESHHSWDWDYVGVQIAWGNSKVLCNFQTYWCWGSIDRYIYFVCWDTCGWKIEQDMIHLAFNNWKLIF